MGLNENKPGLAARKTATTILTRVIDDHRGMDGLFDTRHGPSSYKELSPADQTLVRAIATANFRHRGEVEFALSKMMDRPPPKKARHLIHTMHVAATQIMFMDIPDSAAVDLAVSAINEDQRSQRFASLANAVLRRLSREKSQFLENADPLAAARANMPAPLLKRLKKAYGRDRTDAILLQHMLEPVLDITVKENPELWAESLGGVTLFGNSIRVNASGKIDTWEGYDDGAWWVQDVAASLPAHLMGDIAGKQVADLCAAPGGKTAQLIMAGAEVTAVEASASRAKRLEANLERLQLNANIVIADLMEWQPPYLFDAILLDAPCSSTGTIRRHPDVQWTKTDEQIDGLAELQRTMILRAAHFLKPGGKLVFSNCSLDRAEGEDVFAKLVKGQFGLDADKISSTEVFGRDEMVTGQGTVRTLPSHLSEILPPVSSQTDPRRFQGMDGFFAARFIRNDDELKTDTVSLNSSDAVE